MKVLRYVVLILLILAVIGILLYQGFVAKSMETSDLIKALLILAGLILSLLRPRKTRQVSNKKALYSKAYAEFIQNAFSEDPKLEKAFYNAVHDYNQDKPAAGIKKLSQLRKDCQRSGDLYAVTVFTALCYDDMQLYEDAIREYKSALSIRPNTTLASNMGLCYQRTGDNKLAMKAYDQAIQIDKNNAFALNNISALYFREGDYESALNYAEAAIDINNQMPQALSTAAMCCALLEDREGYKNYYRRAVSAGYDGNKIKSAIQALNEEI